MLYYFYVLLGSFIVDLLPFVGPPAWMVMVFFQMKYSLNIWVVLVIGVAGSSLGRYVLSKYIPWLSERYIKVQKNEDLKFVGERLSQKGWKVPLFVFLYTLVPMPSTPIFTAAGMARIPTIQILPAFFAGKFISDMIMVMTGEYVANNAVSILEGWLSWKSLFAILPGIVVILAPLFIDWRALMQHKKFRLNFRIWK